MPLPHKTLSIVNDFGIHYVLEESKDGPRILRVATHEDLHRIPLHAKLGRSTPVPIALLLGL